MDPMDLSSLVYLNTKENNQQSIYTSIHTWNTIRIFRLMIDLHEIDTIKEGMILNIFISIGHTTKSSCHVDYKHFFNQISQFIGERCWTCITLIDDCSVYRQEIFYISIQFNSLTRKVEYDPCQKMAVDQQPFRNIEQQMSTSKKNIK